jgi:spore coat polysaccharide biosynthesis protein SpsF
VTVKGGGRTAKADVILRCDGGPAIGLGHVKRGLAIAEQLRRDHELTPLFAGRFEEGAAALLKAQGFAQADLQGAEEPWLARLAAEAGARAVLFDIRTGLAPSALEALRAHGTVTVTLDDASPRRLAADLAVLPPTPLVQALEWSGFRGEALIGWAWQVLAAAPVQRISSPDEGDPLTLLVTMGGADPAGLTERMARLLLPLARAVRPLFVIGPAFAQPVALRTALHGLWAKAEIAFKPDSLAPLITKADLALVAYGITAQELAASGVPALYLGLSEDHVESAEALAATGAGLCLGRHDVLGDAAIRAAVASLIGDRVRRKAMALAGPRTLDGRGAARLAARIAELIRIRKIA